MTQARLITDLTDDMLLAAFFGALFFVVSYTLTSRWWRHAIGTTLIMLDTGLMLSIGPAVLHRLFGVPITGNIGFAWYFLCSLALVAAGVWWRAWVMLRLNWRSRHGGRKPDG